MSARGQHGSGYRIGWRYDGDDMARHRNIRLLSYDEYDDYDDEDDAEQFEEGVLYSATDVHALSMHEEGDSGLSLRECVAAVRNRMGSEGLKVGVQRIEAALSEAGGDLDIAAAMITSTLKPICVSPPNPPSRTIGGSNRLSSSPELSPALLPTDHQPQREMVNQATDKHLQNREDSKGGEVPPVAAASSQSGQQFSAHTSARRKLQFDQSCDVPTTTSSGTTISSSSPTTSGSGRYSHSSPPRSCEKSHVPPVEGDKSPGEELKVDTAKRERCVCLKGPTGACSL